MKFTEEMSNKLNDLLEKNYDAEKGYKKAAEKVENTELQQFFNEQAQKRYDFGHELKTEIIMAKLQIREAVQLAQCTVRGWILKPLFPPTMNQQF